MILDNRITTIQNASNIKEVIENSKIKFDFSIPNNYLNYLKIIAYPDAKFENYARPMPLPNINYYNIFNEDVTNEFKLQTGDHILLVYPDVVLTKEMCRFLPSLKQPRISVVYDYNCNTKKITTMGVKPINNTNVEKYRNIASFIKFSEPLFTKTAFTSAPFKPIVFEENSEIADVRLLPFFKDLEKSDIPYKMIKETKEIRYITKLDSLDDVCTVEGLPITIDPDETQEEEDQTYYDKMKELIFQSKSEEEITKLADMPSRLLVKLMKNMSLAMILKYSHMSTAPCLIIKYTTEKPISMILQSKMELFKYNEAIVNYNIVDNYWLPIMKHVIKIFQICYFLNVEEILSMLIKNNGVTINIPKEKDRVYLNNLSKMDEFKRIISVIIQIWQLYQQTTNL